MKIEKYKNRYSTIILPLLIWFPSKFNNGVRCLQIGWLKWSWTILLTFFLIAGICLSGCASVTVNPHTGNVKTFTVFKSVDINDITYVRDPNGAVFCKVKGVSHVSSYADSIIATLAAVLIAIFGN